MLIPILWLSSKVGGLLASGLLSVGDFGTVTSWRKVFFIEGEILYFANYDVLMKQGIITTGFGLLCFLIIPTDPQRTRMFTPAERALALARIDADQAVRTNGRKESTTLRLVWRSFNINVCAVQLYLGVCLTNLLDHDLYDCIRHDQHLLPRTESLHAYCGGYM